MNSELQFLIDAAPMDKFHVPQGAASFTLNDAIEACRSSGLYYFARKLLEDPMSGNNVDLVLKWIKTQTRENFQDYHPHDIALFCFSLVLHDLKIDNTRTLELVVALSKAYGAWWTHQLYVWLISKN